VKNACVDALEEWCDVTGINFSISEEEATTFLSLPGDGINMISWEELGGAAKGALVLGGAYFEKCLNPVTGKDHFIMKELDIQIDDNATNPLKVKNFMVHEFGHTHMLQHSVNPNTSSSNPVANYLMFYEQTGFGEFDEASIKTNDAIGAELVFVNSMEILNGSSCADPIGKGSCSNTNAVDDLLLVEDFKIIPNPNNGLFMLEFSDTFRGEVKWEIKDISGKK